MIGLAKRRATKPWRVRFVEWAETAFGGRLYQLILKVEHAVKGPAFGCQMCGQCALRYTAFVCPMQCPKGLRNGPCGGAADGHCEVYPDRACVWVKAYNRSRLLGREEQLERLQPAMDWSLFGTSAWLNHLAGRDSHLFGPAPAAEVTPLPAPVNLERLLEEPEREAA